MTFSTILWRFTYQTTNQIINKSCNNQQFKCFLAVAILLIVINFVLNITGWSKDGSFVLLYPDLMHMFTYTDLDKSRCFFLYPRRLHKSTFIFQKLITFLKLFFHYIGSLQQQEVAGKWIRNLDYNQVMKAFGQRQWGKNTRYMVMQLFGWLICVDWQRHCRIPVCDIKAVVIWVW